MFASFNRFSNSLFLSNLIQYFAELVSSSIKRCSFSVQLFHLFFSHSFSFAFHHRSYDFTSRLISSTKCCNSFILFRRDFTSCANHPIQRSRSTFSPNFFELTIFDLVLTTLSFRSVCFCFPFASFTLAPHSRFILKKVSSFNSSISSNIEYPFSANALRVESSRSWAFLRFCSNFSYSRRW